MKTCQQCHLSPLVVGRGIFRKTLVNQAEYRVKALGVTMYLCKAHLEMLEKGVEATLGKSKAYSSGVYSDPVESWPIGGGDDGD